MAEDEAELPRAQAPPGVRKWIAVLAVCFVLSIGIPIGYATWLVASYAQHSCAALNLIIAKPPPHPTAAQGNFYKAIRQWADGDGC